MVWIWTWSVDSTQTCQQMLKRGLDEEDDDDDEEKKEKRKKNNNMWTGTHVCTLSVWSIVDYLPALYLL